MESIKRPASPNDVEGPYKVPRTDDGAGPSALITLMCILCNAVFNSVSNLNRHMKNQHGENVFSCDSCLKSFQRKDNLVRHMKTHTASFPCDVCGKAFTNKYTLKTHAKSHQRLPRGMEAVSLTLAGDPVPPTDPRQPPSATCPPSSCQSALKGSVERHRVQGTEDDVDLPSFFRSQNHGEILKKALAKKKSIKFWISINVKLMRPKNWLTTGDQTASPYFTSRCARILQVSDIDLLLEKAYEKMCDDFAKWMRNGSGWVIDHINFVDLTLITYKPLKGSSYVPLPHKIAKTRGVINVHNTDNKCFLWALLSSLHPAVKDPQRVSKYVKFEDTLNIDNLKFPMSPDDIPKFEQLNGITINLFGYGDKELFPIYISDTTFEEPINLLLISDGQTQHYCWIKDFGKLMHSNTKHNGRAFYCMYCLHRFSEQCFLDAHRDSCKKHGPQKIEMPEGDNQFLKFMNGDHMMPVPYVIYADFESIIIRMDVKAGDHTTRTAEHKPASFSYVVVGPDGTLHEPPFLYRGNDCAKVFLDQMKLKEKEIDTILKQNIPMKLTEKEEAQFQASTNCHICKKPLTGVSHRDHCHLTGAYK